MKKLRKLNSSGQAVIEYIFILAFLAFIGVIFVRGVNVLVTETMGGLAYALSVQLSVGVCPSGCMMGYEAFGNGM